MIGKRSVDTRPLRTRYWPLVVALLFMSALSTWAQEEANEKETVVLFYSDIGQGHIKAAEAIEADVKKRNPQVEVVKKNIRDFETKLLGSRSLQRYTGEKIYWWLVNNRPDLFTKFYQAKMETGRKVKNFHQWSTDYVEEEVGEFLQKIGQKSKLKAVVATHYGAAQTLGNMKAKKKLPGDLAKTPIGWLHTDYIEGYFPRISQYVDKTFLPHKKLEEVWRNYGVSEEKIATTGMPLNPKIDEPFSEEEKKVFLKEQGLDPQALTIVLTGGGEGVGNFPLIVKSLSDKLAGILPQLGHQKLQIVAVTAKNKEHFKNLQALKAKLPPQVELKVEGMVPQPVLFKYEKASQLFITKTGGLSPTEGFAINKPMILLDVYGGHEKENAEFFEKFHMGLINHNQSEIGEQAATLLQAQKEMEEMVAAQQEIKKSLDISKITDFIFEGKSAQEFNQDLGRQDGTSLREVAIPEIKKLDQAAPADFEILLSHELHDGRRLLPNPFGHLAIRVKGKVFTANGVADVKNGDHLMEEFHLADYLYGTQGQTVDGRKPKAYYLDAYGEAYGRDVTALRVSGVNPKRIERMLQELEKIEQEWKEGKTCWHKTQNNCADLAERVLKAGGYDTTDIKEFRSSLLKFTLPVDFFNRYRKLLESKFSNKLEVVQYSQVADSQAVSEDTGKVYGQSQFPLAAASTGKLVKRLLKRVVSPDDTTPGEEEKLVTKRIASYPGGILAFENIDGSNFSSLQRQWQDSGAKNSKARLELQNLEEEIAAEKVQLAQNGLSSQGVQVRFEELSKKLTPEELNKVEQGLDGQLPQEKLELVKGFRQFVQSWSEKQGAHQAKVDDYIQKQLTYYVDKVQDELPIFVENLKGRIDAQKYEEIKQAVKKLAEEFKNYHKVKSLYGNAKDHRRLKAYAQYFKSAMNLVQSINQQLKSVKKGHLGSEEDEESKQQQSDSSLIWRLGSGLYNSVAGMAYYAKLAYNIVPQAASILKEAYYPSTPQEGVTPVPSKVTQLMKSTAEQLGKEVIVEGRENLHFSSPFGKDVTVFAPTHYDAIEDSYFMGHILEGHDHMVFAAVDQFLPRSLANKAQQVPGLISVGRGSGQPVDKAVRHLKENLTHNIWIYPQGMTGINNEPRPVREGFQSQFLKRLHDEGYRVHLVPITYWPKASFLGHEAPIEQNDLVAKVGQPLQPALVKILLDQKSVGSYIRANWMESARNTGPVLNGQLRVEAMDKVLEKLLKLPPEFVRGTQKLMNGRGLLQLVSSRQEDDSSYAPCLDVDQDLSTSVISIDQDDPLALTSGLMDIDFELTFGE